VLSGQRELPEPIALGADLQLRVLGCDGTYAGPGGACSGYLVSSPSTHLWLDAGPGTLSRIQRHIALTDVSAVVITHEHPDHSGELPVLRNALRFLFGVEGLPVITTAGTRRLADQLTGGAEPTFAWDHLADGAERQIGDLRLRFVETDHPVETLAVRIDHPSGSIAYSADTGGALDGARLDPDGTGVDVLVVEASMSAEQEDAVQHLSARQAARLAQAAGARRVVVTHVVPGTEPARRSAEVAAALAELGSDAEVITAADHQTPG
jgi:ribonuclease BN (tRNA processing enzyme)